MKINLLKYWLVAVGSAVLLVGCASNPASGTTGNDSQTIQGSGPNGSVGPGNPLGIGDGGLTR